MGLGFYGPKGDKGDRGEPGPPGDSQYDNQFKVGEVIVGPIGLPGDKGDKVNMNINCTMHYLKQLRQLFLFSILINFSI